MTKFPKADAFHSIHIEPLRCNGIRGVAYTGSLLHNQAAIVGPDDAGALLMANRLFGGHFSESGAQRVVMLPEAKFYELLKLAGIDAPEAE